MSWSSVRAPQARSRRGEPSAALRRPAGRFAHPHPPGDDTEVKVAERDVGWILDRTRFDAFLADRAASEGVEVLVGTEAAGMTRGADDRWHVKVRGVNGEATCRARIVIGTDGVEAMVGRWA